MKSTSFNQPSHMSQGAGRKSRTTSRNSRVASHEPHLLLEGEEGPNASIDRVLDPCICLVAQRVDGIVSRRGRELLQPLGDVGGPEDLVYVGEPRALVRLEVGRKHARRRALPAERECA